MYMYTNTKGLKLKSWRQILQYSDLIVLLTHKSLNARIHVVTIYNFPIETQCKKKWYFCRFLRLFLHVLYIRDPIVCILCCACIRVILIGSKNLHLQVASTEIQALNETEQKVVEGDSVQDDVSHEDDVSDSSSGSLDDENAWHDDVSRRTHGFTHPNSSRKQVQKQRRSWNIRSYLWSRCERWKFEQEIFIFEYVILSQLSVYMHLPFLYPEGARRLKKNDINIGMLPTCSTTLLNTTSIHYKMHRTSKLYM